MGQNNLSIAIIGGGIGGLAAALSLLQAGFDVHVYEQVRAPREIGAGIVLTPNATRLLYRLGLQGRLEAVGVAPLAWRQRRWDDGRTLMFTSVAVSPGAPALLAQSRQSKNASEVAFGDKADMTFRGANVCL